MSNADPSDDEDVITNTTSDLPSLFVDERLLNNENRIGNVATNQITYRINDSVFVDNECEETRIVEFEVYAERVDDKTSAKMDHDFDIYCSTPTESESEYEDDNIGNKTLPISIQEVPHGIIVNSNVYLTNHQWNTLIFIDVKKVQCAVCNVYSDLDTCPEHVATDRHKKNLDSHRPLERFDLSVARKIRNKYHCAVCNELFDASDNYDHFNSKMHEGNQLFAINKASDIMYDYDIHNNDNVDKKIDCYHFNENNIKRNDDEHHNESSTNDDVSTYSDYTNNDNYINFQNKYFYNDFDIDYEEAPVNNGMSYASMAKKPKVILQQFVDIDLGNKKVRVKFDSWHMIISPKLNRFYCMVCKKFDHMRLKPDHCNDVEHLKNLDKCKVVEAYEEYFIRQVDGKLYHCGHCNNLQLIHEMVDHVESNHPRKNKIFTEITPSPLISSPQKNINNDDKKHDENTKNDTTGTPVKNMNSVPVHNQNNGVGTPVKNYDKTIQRPQTNDRVNTPVKDYDRTIQRPQNNDKLGTPVKYCDKTIQRPVISDNKTTNIDRQVTKTDNGVAANANSFNDRNRSNDVKLPGIFDNIIIFPFGYKLTIPMLYYNIVCKRPNDFYCGLCDIICPENMITRHLYEIRHIELLQRTPFIVPFSCHLIRGIREALHCAICNMPITAAKIHEHFTDVQHVNSLSKALGLIAAPVNIPLPSAKSANVVGKTVDDVKTVLNVKTATDLKTTSNVATVVITNNDRKISRNDIQTVAAQNTVINDNKRDVNDNKGDFNVNKRDVNDNKGDFNVNKRDFNDKKGDFNDNKGDFNVIGALKEPVPNISNKLDLIEDLYDNLNETIDSVASEDVTFDMEEFVYLKLRNSFIKIANTSYNTLVHIGDGSRYCFVCASQVDYGDLQRHVESRGHLQNMEKYRFLDKYEDHLLRQIFLMYHCCICNVIITRKELRTHLEWPTHALQNENTLKNIKKTRKNEIKGGVKQIVVSTQKENIYLNEKEPKIKIRFNAQITDRPEGKSLQKRDSTTKVLEDSAPESSKMNKIIILYDNVLKISWESWHGVSKIKNGYKCNLCQRELKTNEIEVHCSGEWHRYALDKPFEKQHAPALIRKINELTLNCLICNTEVSNKEHLVTEHINGKKHIKNYESILKDSSQANTYADCNNDVLML